jgi:hypothetical protein
MMPLRIIQSLLELCCDELSRHKYGTILVSVLCFHPCSNTVNIASFFARNNGSEVPNIEEPLICTMGGVDNTLLLPAMLTASLP